jgi:hypothetical protein
MKAHIKEIKIYAIVIYAVLPFLKHSSNLEACKIKKVRTKNIQNPIENKIGSIIFFSLKNKTSK